jgi:diguanylate cyclase (GGDEF)-like protein
MDQGDLVAPARRWLLPVALPVLLVALILAADAVEGPKTAYVGVLAVVPMFSAVFGTPKQVAAVAVVSWLAGLAFGLVASDGNVPAQRVRLVIIALSGLAAVLAARHRLSEEVRLRDAEREAARVAQMREQADTDLLTSALNRRGVLRSLGLADIDDVQPVARPSRSSPWTVALVDLDAFKLVNDRHGHVAGDEFLRAVSRRLDRAVAESDLVGRWGGDEFILVLTVAPDRAEPVLRRVQDTVTRMPIETSDGQVPAEVSIGAAAWGVDEAFDSVLRRSDHALYEGKQAGGGRLVIDPQLPCDEQQPPESEAG